MSRVVRILPDATDLFGVSSPRVLLSCGCIAAAFLKRGAELDCVAHVYAASAAVRAERKRTDAAQADNRTAPRDVQE